MDRDDLRRPVPAALFVRMADYRVHRRMWRDPRYRNAGNAEARAAAAAAIKAEVLAALGKLYRVA